MKGKIEECGEEGTIEIPVEFTFSTFRKTRSNVRIQRWSVHQKNDVNQRTGLKIKYITVLWHYFIVRALCNFTFNVYFIFSTASDIQLVQPFIINALFGSAPMILTIQGTYLKYGPLEDEFLHNRMTSLHVYDFQWNYWQTDNLGRKNISGETSDLWFVIF